MNEDTQKLFGKFVDGRLSEAEFAEFEQRLRESQELRQSYIRYAEVHGLLNSQKHARQPRRAEVMKPSFDRQVWSFVCGAGLAASLALFVYWAIGLRQQEPTTDKKPVFQRVRLDGQTSVAVVQGVDRALEQSLSVGTSLKPGILTLSQGQVNLVFGSGAEVQLQGPAELHLLRESAATLVRGSAHIHLPISSGKFVLNTPHSSHAQRFARYQLTVTESESLVQVHEGELVVSRLDSKGFTYTSMILKTSERLRSSADEMKMVDAVDVQDSDAEASPLTDGSFKPLEVTNRYVQLVKHAGPLLYWRFEGAELEAGIKNEVSDANHGVLHFAHEELPFDFVDGALLFRGTETPRTVQTQATLPNFLNKEFTIELWVNQDNTSLHQSILSLGPAADVGQRKHYLLLEFIDETARIVHPRRSFRFLFRNPAGAANGINLFTRGGLASRTWHYIVAQKDAVSLRFFYNGQQIGESGAMNKQVEDDLIMYLGQLRRRDGERPFCGHIDELAIYPRALTPAEIETHYRAIVPEPSPPNAVDLFPID